MKVTKKLTKTSQGKMDLLKMRLQTTRLKKMLENTRGIIDFIDDGKEKLSGEYIFDRYYNVSLVDKIIERTRGVVFDSSVLVPEGSRQIYSSFDECKKFAEESLLSPFTQKDITDRPGSNDEAFEDTPEYKMLTDVLSWAGIFKQENKKSIMDIVSNIFDHVFLCFEKNKSSRNGTYQLEIESHGYTNHIELIDLGEGISEAKDGLYSFDNLKCRPLRLILEENFENRLKGSEKPGGNWLATITDSYLGLQNLDPGCTLHLETTLVDNMDSNFIFLYSKNVNIEKKQLQPECSFTKTPLGRLTWNNKTDLSGFEKNIGQIGDILFRGEGSHLKYSILTLKPA
ncbi:MAG TPA: hypothetical protein DD405_04390 [Desulfobacteraceae bacterium]|nr:hypothetical protein [Desulfobacteraceae bacterium]